MSTIVAFVLNDARTDSRVLREAATFAAAGHDVTLVARTADPYAAGPERERRDGFTIVRVPVADGPLRWILLARRPRALVAAAVHVVRHRPVRFGAGALVALAALPVALLVLAASAVGLLVIGAAPGARAAWLAVSWRLQWRFGVVPWTGAAVAAGAEAARSGRPGGLVLQAHDLRALPAAIGVQERLGRGSIVYDSHEVFVEAGAHAERPPVARRALRSLERGLAARVDALVTVNGRLAALLGPELGIGRVVVAHNCPPRWTPPEGFRSPLRTAAGVPAGAPLLLYHGGLAPGRGIEVLAAALEQPGLEEAHLVFMGSGPSRVQVEALTRQGATAPRIHLLDPVPPDRLLEWVAGADAVVAPIQPTTLNHRLSTPNKVFEAIAAGVPVVAADLPAMAPIVMDWPAGPLGAVADPSDPAAFAAAIRSILELSPEDLGRLRGRCLEAAHERWNWETESAGLLDLAASLAGEGASGPPAIVPQRAVIVLPTTGQFDARTRRLASSLAARGHDVTILGRAGDGLPNDEMPEPGVRLVRVGEPADPARVPVPPVPSRATRPWLDPRRIAAEATRISRVALRARRQRIAAARVTPAGDLLHAMGFLALPVATSLARQAGRPFVYDARDLYVESNNIARLPSPLRRLFLLRERRWAQAAARVFTVNESCADYLERSLRVPRPAIVMNGQEPWDEPAERPDHLRRALGLPAGCPVVLYHGGFMRDRGLPELIAAMQHPGLEDVHLVLMGDGPVEAEVRATAAASATGGRVHILPPVAPATLLAWVASADVGAMPNQPRTMNERLSTPNKLFECLAAGTPVVSSDFPERRRILLEGPDAPLGAVCDPTDTRSIAEAIRSILDLEPGEADALRRRCRTAAATRFSWGAQMRVVLEEYGRITGRPW